MDRAVMSKKKISKKDALKILSQMSKQSLQNGIDFYNDALLIYNENKSYGHAFGFLILAEEEYAKSWYLHVVHERIRNNLMYYSDQEDAPKLSAIISNHKAKQIALEILAKMTAVFLNKPELPHRDDVTDDEAFEVFKEIMEEIDNPKDNNLKKAFKRIERDYGAMQRNREEGFYVDFDANSKIIKGPHKITKNECEKQFAKAQYSLWICNIWIAEKITKKDIPLIKKLDTIEEE
jgi:AbiV family abortive infection protein